MAVGTLAFVVGAYLLGSMPSAYLLACTVRGIDIRQVGSGNVGGSNLRATLGVWATVTVGLIDVAKGALSVWLARTAGLGDTAAMLAGLAAVAGHNWSPWLAFQGGRGIASTLGMLLIAFPLGTVWVLGSMALGSLTRHVALLNGLGVLTLPLLSHWVGAPATVKRMAFALALLMLVKRLEANRAFKPFRRKVWLARLLRDRDER